MVKSSRVRFNRGLGDPTGVFTASTETAPTDQNPDTQRVLLPATKYGIPQGSTGYAAAGDKAPPTWTIIACYAAIGLGTMFGGWRIVRTMGQKITKLKPVGGFCAETGGALTLFLATAIGVPVSTTHTITGAIVGVGSTQRMSAVCWGVAGNIVWAWIFTIPASAFVAAIAYWISLQLF